MAKAEFASDYTHRWPSGAETDYKAGWSGTVKQEVLDAAAAAGALVESKARRAAPDKPATTETKRKRGRPRAAAKPTPAPAPPAPLPPADDAAARDEEAPGAVGEPAALAPNIHVDADSDSQ